MAKKEEKMTPETTEELIPEETTETEAAETVEAPQEAESKNPFEEKYNAEHDSYLRLAAEFDNFRKRTVKEKEQSYGNGRADAVEKMLPVYDNLERALKQDTADEAYKKGVEMTMTQLKEVLSKLGVTEIEAAGQPFDPKLHNAVMHVEDEAFGANTVAEVFQAGFQLGEKVIRFAMVKVAN